MNFRLIAIFTVCVFVLSVSYINVNAEELPVFSLAWSEYPSWSVFGVADELDIVKGKQGELSAIEKKWGVDIVLKEAEYDPCLVMYGSGQCDAVCITNMDILNPANSIPSVAILPTSTSNGADACIVTGEITDIKQLKGKKVYGLSKTVSEYCFVRNLELLGEKEFDYKFTNQDPSAAALAMQQKQKGYDAIVVWNPFVLETLNKRKDATVLFDSTSIPGEIIDMVVVSKKVLDGPKGKDFAHALIDIFYAVNDKIEDPATRDDTLLALGEKFSHLNLQSMRKVVKQTKFYKTPDEGIELFSDPVFEKIMDKVVSFCVEHEVIGKKFDIYYKTPEEEVKSKLVFETSFMEKIKETRENVKVKEIIKEEKTDIK